MTSEKKAAFFSLGIVWLGLALGGMKVLLDYQARPADAAPSPRTWPEEGSSISRVPGRATLVFWAHPHCPCTRASLGELAWIMSHSPSHPTAHVIFAKSAGLPRSWEKTDLWRAAADIPGVQVSVDDGGILARSFRVAASGHVLLYDPRGRLEFSGGITGARGHAGDNIGKSAILSFLRDGGSIRGETPVFGCFLAEPKPQEDERWRAPWML